MNKKILISVASLTIIPLLLASCSNNSAEGINSGGSGNNPTNSYTITWKNWDGSVLETDRNVAYGSTPSYDGATPTRSGGSQYKYTFDGWSPSVTSVTSDATYTAQYEKAVLVQSISLSPSYIRINVGQSYAFAYSKTPYNATETIVLQTEDDTILSIESNKVTALTAGETKVFIETQNGTRSETVVQVIGIEPVDDFTLDNWSNPAYFVTETCDISEISFSFDTVTYQTSTSQRLNYSMKLTKTYCKYSGSYKFKVNWKIYDPNDTVVDNGTFTSASFSVGETTVMSGHTYVDWNSSCPAGMYRIVLSAVAW